MRSETKNIINAFSDYSSWLNQLQDIDDSLWSKPIATGKWSVSEIVAHIIKWDHHLLSEIIPSVQKGDGMVFPEYDPFNKKASDYAKSGVSQSQLLEEAKNKRNQLINKLNELSRETLYKPLTANGITHCPHTGTPYSLIYIVKEMIDHDHHHQKQIIHFLKQSN
ncbi:DinB family protein [Piscibacillus halophilus]|uniref:Uncharacterized damage-inducible protein DinB (Forms a four-helix bundle) n=1 Tax=Piscibacillus halophilus TaxID=571933 RepID=A0A1H9ABT9_9BACI|nr:DinB family protein [Piscibacillus halophilus]SEP73893.1 Uncharacterized damage-inducible protein DinB (forms a four-helix bundle) [Piscibacillus halophilus]